MVKVAQRMPSAHHIRLFKPIFIIVLALALLLTIVALFTPAWRIYQNRGGNPANSIFSSTTVYDGLITNNCADNFTLAQCGEMTTWEVTVLVLIAIAVVGQVVVFVWTVVSYSPQCRPSMFYPIPVLCLIATIALIVGIALYGANFRYYQGGMPSFSFNYPLNPQQYSNPTAANAGMLGSFSQVSLGYSYWLALAGAVVMVLATFLSCAAAAGPNIERHERHGR